MNYIIDPQNIPQGIAAQCTCNCTINFGAVKSSGSCGTYCPRLTICTSPSGIKVSPSNS